MSWPVGSLLKEFASVPLWVCWSSPYSFRYEAVLQALLATQWLSCQQAPGSAWWPPCFRCKDPKKRLLHPMERKRKCSHMKATCSDKNMRRWYREFCHQTQRVSQVATTTSTTSTTSTTTIQWTTQPRCQHAKGCCGSKESWSLWGHLTAGQVVRQNQTGKDENDCQNLRIWR